MKQKKTSRPLSVLELKISPVMAALLLAAGMWFLARGTTSFPMAPTLRAVLSGTLLAAGAAFGLAGILSFRRARTTVNPWRVHASSTLVISGVYRRSRNPMYLGLLLALAGWGIYLSNLYALLLGFTFVPYMNRFQIRPEERAMERAYGEEFREYCRRVRRWL